MNFEKVIDDIEKLIGIEIESINSKTPNLILTEVDREKNKYYFKLSSNERVQTRPFEHLEKIWLELVANRVANVEVVLEGSNSSRHVHETILANLPYIEYLKYDRKKHLFLASEETHEIGEIKEAKSSDVKKIKSALDNLKKFDRVNFSNEFSALVESFDSAIKDVRIKFPGELKASKLNAIQNGFNDLLERIKGTYVSPIIRDDGESNYIKTLQYSDETIELDAPEIIGYEGGTLDEIDGNGNIDEEAEEHHELANSRIRFTPTTVSLVYDRLLHNEIELQPDFQRKGRIWSPHNKSALIESILIGLPIPTFYFAERPNGSWVIVDGLQRTTTLFDFISNKFQLKELKYLKNLNTKTFEGLPRPYQRKIREYQLHCHIISITKDSDKMVRELFQRINTYGVKMSYQEIRCALYPGSSVKFLRFIAESKEFQLSTFKKIQPKRMKDMELVLGAISHILFGYRKFNENKFDSFLTKAMQELNKNKKFVADWDTNEYSILTDENNERQSYPTFNKENSDEIFSELINRFNHALELAAEVFGSSRFKKELGGTVVSKPLFELIVSVFSLLNDTQRALVMQYKKEIKSGFYELVSGQIKPYVDWESDHFKGVGRGFEYSISQSTGKRITIVYRFENFISLLNEILGQKIEINGVLENQ